MRLVWVNEFRRETKMHLFGVIAFVVGFFLYCGCCLLWCGFLFSIGYMPHGDVGMEYGNPFQFKRIPVQPQCQKSLSVVCDFKLPGWGRMGEEERKRVYFGNF